MKRLIPCPSGTLHVNRYRQTLRLAVDLAIVVMALPELSRKTLVDFLDSSVGRAMALKAEILKALS